MKRFFTLSLLFLAVTFINAQVILQESFDAGIPDAWVQVTTASDGGWIVGAAGDVSSAAFPIPDQGSGNIAVSNDDGCNCDKISDRLILPEMNLSAVTAPVFRFDMFYGALTYGGVAETATVEVSTDGGTTWEVLETLAGNTDAWQTDYVIDLSAYAGLEQVWVSFNYSDGGGWLYGWAVDNISVFQPLANDVELRNLAIPAFNELGTDVAIAGEIVNRGIDTLNSVEITWSDGTNDYTDMVTGLDIPTNGTYSFTHSTTFNIAEAISYDFSVWAANPNGVMDGNDTDNLGSAVAAGVSYIPSRKMVAEEATGTWCGWCPRGHVWMAYMTENYHDDFIGVAVHNSDPMEVAEYDGGLTSFPGFSGFPSVIVDRKIITDPSDLETVLPASLARISPVASDVSASLDVASKTINIDASAEFVTQLDGIDYRLNVVLTENGVTGTGNGFNQVNYYSNNIPLEGAGIDWQAAPDPVPAADMVYDHVGRAILGGWAGFANSVPTSVVAGDMATGNYTYDFPCNDWDPKEMHVIVMVLNNETQEILSAEEKVMDIICPDNLDLLVAVTDESIPGAADGAIAINGSVSGCGSITVTAEDGSTPELENLSTGSYVLVATDHAGCEETTTIDVGLVSSLDEITSLSSFSLAPNPTADVTVLNVSFNKYVDFNIQVVDVMGKVLTENNIGQTRGGAFNLDMSDYTNGVYFVRMTVDDQTHVERVMVSK